MEAVIQELKVNSVVQVSPEGAYKNTPWASKLLIVEEIKKWGVQGYVIEPPEGSVKFRGKAYLRVAHEEFALIGDLRWVEQDEEET